MRFLTIKRHKTFVGCLAKLKVYIEDQTSSELTIDGVPCRKIGDLKNGEEKRFEIGEGSAKVFVIADKLSKNCCSDCYELPEGTEDVYLSGKNKFDLATMHAFRFDHNEGEQAAQYRKRGSKVGLIVLGAAVLVGVIAGLFSDTVISFMFSGPKSFAYQELTLTLTQEFDKEADDGFDVVYSTDDVAVMVIKDKKELFEDFDTWTVEDYCEAVWWEDNDDIPFTDVKKIDGLAYFEYDTEGKYHYWAFVYKQDDAFWFVQFGVPLKKVQKYESKVMEWASSATFAE